MAGEIWITLSVLYMIMAVYVLAQIISLLRAKHMPFSYKAIFNWFALLWMVLRAVFWICFSVNENLLPQTAFYLLFWGPNCIIYMTFATLALFLTKVIKRRQWTRKYRNRFLVLYGVMGLLDTVGTVVLSLEAANASDPDVFGGIESCGTAVLFLFLSFAFV
jgi:hypothetical protein